jgi:hypothetical protein
MASYQDIDVRLSVVEDKIDFILDQFKVQQMTPTGMFNDKGQPLTRIDIKTLKQVYIDLKNGTIEQVPLETVNGTE